MYIHTQERHDARYAYLSKKRSARKGDMTIELEVVNILCRLDEY